MNEWNLFNLTFSIDFWSHSVIRSKFTNTLEITCDIGNILSQWIWKVFPLNDDEHANYLRRVLELYPFYSQCVLIPGMAIERWLLICRPTQASSVLKSRHILFFYIGISTLSLLIPSVILAEFVWFQFNPISLIITPIMNVIYVDGEIQAVLTNEFTASREVSANWVA